MMSLSECLWMKGIWNCPIYRTLVVNINFCHYQNFVGEYIELSIIFCNPIWHTKHFHLWSRFWGDLHRTNKDRANHTGQRDCVSTRWRVTMKHCTTDNLLQLEYCHPWRWLVACNSSDQSSDQWQGPPCFDNLQTSNSYYQLSIQCPISCWNT